MQVINSLKSRIIRLPFQSAVDIVAGSVVMKGTTSATDRGVAIVGDVAGGCAAANGYAIGILAEKHTFATQGSALVAGAEHSAVISGATGGAWFAPVGGNPEIFPSRQIELIKSVSMCRIDYSLTGVAATSSSGTTVTVASLEDNIDTGFIYVATNGTGSSIGKLRFIDTAASGSCTTAVSLGAGDVLGTGTVVKILPLLHNLFVVSIGNTTTASVLSTTAAVGTARIVQLERHIVRNGIDEILDPFAHGNLSGLNSLAQFQLYGVFAIENTLFSPMA